MTPASAPICNQHGIVLGKMSHPDWQIEDCRLALEHASGDPDILHKLGICLTNMGQLEAALPIVADVAMCRGPATDRAWVSECKRQLRRSAEAIADLEHALSMSPEYDAIRDLLVKARRGLAAR